MTKSLYPHKLRRAVWQLLTNIADYQFNCDCQPIKWSISPSKQKVLQIDMRVLEGTGLTEILAGHEYVEKPEPVVVAPAIPKVDGRILELLSWCVTSDKRKILITVPFESPLFCCVGDKLCPVDNRDPYFLIISIDDDDIPRGIQYMTLIALVNDLSNWNGIVHSPQLHNTGEHIMVEGGALHLTEVAYPWPPPEDTKGLDEMLKE
jgi:hypothetical protein